MLAAPLSVIQSGRRVRGGLQQPITCARAISNTWTRPERQRNNYLATAKFDITTTPTINLSVGGSFELGQRQDYDRNNSLLNAENNARVRDLTWRGFVRFTQRFNAREEAEGEKKATIKNAFYSIQLDFSRYDQKIQDDELTDELFKYGYVGKFNTYRMTNYTLDLNRGPSSTTDTGTRW
jgi:hypothetical protein